MINTLRLTHLLDVLDVKCLSFNIELQHIGMSSIKFNIYAHNLSKITFVMYFYPFLEYFPVGVRNCVFFLLAPFT